MSLMTINDKVSYKLQCVPQTKGAQRRMSFETQESDDLGDPSTGPKRLAQFSTSEMDIADALSRKLERMALDDQGTLSLPTSMSTVVSSVQKPRKMYKVWTGKFCKSGDYLGVAPWMAPDAAAYVHAGDSSSRRSSIMSLKRAQVHSYGGHTPTSNHAQSEHVEANSSRKRWSRTVSIESVASSVSLLDGFLPIDIPSGASLPACPPAHCQTDAWDPSLLNTDLQAAEPVVSVVSGAAANYVASSAKSSSGSHFRIPYRLKPLPSLFPSSTQPVSPNSVMPSFRVRRK